MTASNTALTGGGGVGGGGGGGGAVMCRDAQLQTVALEGLLAG